MLNEVVTTGHCETSVPAHRSADNPHAKFLDNNSCNKRHLNDNISVASEVDSQHSDNKNTSDDPSSQVILKLGTGLLVAFQDD